MNIKTAINTIAPFIGTAQTWAIVNGCKGEEREFFKGKILELAETIATMPKSYETDGQGKEAVAILHYFLNGWDWYITEKDAKGNGTRQAFGLVKGFETELGYISIAEIVRAGAELDLHWTPKTLAEIRGKRVA